MSCGRPTGGGKGAICQKASRLVGGILQTGRWRVVIICGPEGVIVKMDEKLFRDEALAVRPIRSMGSVRVAVPLSTSLLAAFSTLFLGTLLAASTLFHYTRREHAIGSLVPRGGLLDIAANANGVVTSLAVTEGAVVRPRDVIAQIATDRSAPNSMEAGASVIGSLRAQQSRLRQDIANTALLEQQQHAALQRELESAAASLQSLEQQAADQDRLVKSVGDVVLRIRPLLAKGYISQMQFQQQEAQLLSAQVARHGLQHQVIDARQAQRAIRDQILTLPLTTAAKLNEQRRELDRTEQDIAQAELAHATMVAATNYGHVASVLVHVGQPVKPDDVLITLIPGDDRLQAEFFLPSRAAGFIHPGAGVALRYRAYPFEKFGIHHGVVISVGTSGISPPEVSRLTHQAPPDEAMYRVVVDLPKQNILAYGKNAALAPGMTVEADIEVERRTLIEWLFEPLYAIAKRSVAP